MRSQRSKNSRAKERAVQIERAFFYDLVWLAFLVAMAIVFLPLASHADDFNAHVAKLGKLNTEIEKANTDLKDLSNQRAHASDPDEKESLHKQMIVAHKQLEKLTVEQEELMTHIRFKHPEQGFEGKLEFHHTLRPLESFENDTTLDGKLDSFLNKFHAVYGTAPKTKKQASSYVDPRAPASSSQIKKNVNPDDVEQALTLSK